MMSDFIFKVCGLALVSALLISLLRKWGADVASLLKLCAGIALAAVCVGAITPIVGFVSEIASGNGEILEAAEFMLRVLAVALIVQVSANACRDCGESTLASYIELGGKVEIVLLSLPLIKEIITVSVGMI